MLAFYLNKKSLAKFSLFLVLFFGSFLPAAAQLSDLHYLPPLRASRIRIGINTQALYISTPETSPFNVNIYRGTNPTPMATVTVSNANPIKYSLPDGQNNITLVNELNTGVPSTLGGLRLKSSGGQRFYVNFRGTDGGQATYLTSKGRSAMGKRFKWGGARNIGRESTISNTMGIMATEDNTTITVSDYDTGVRFRQGSGIWALTDNSYTITLNANETFVFETYVGNLPQTDPNRYGMLGASIVADKDIVVSNGHILLGRIFNSGPRDVGIDQIVPIERLGTEYAFIRGFASKTNQSTIEIAAIIAAQDNTEIYVNGANTPIAVIDEGDYYEVSGDYYSSNNVGANMYIRTSKAAYAYQVTAGSFDSRTIGLNFVAPLSCFMPSIIDNVPVIRDGGGTFLYGGVTLIASTTTPDENIVVTDGNGVVTKPASLPLTGNPDWKTFFIPDLIGNVTVESTGLISLGLLGYSNNAGAAGYYSGFDRDEKVVLESQGSRECIPASGIIEVTEGFDAYEWFHNGELMVGENTPRIDPVLAGEYFVRVTRGICQYDSEPSFYYYCTPDIHVEKEVDKPLIIEGETANFTIKVTNNSIDPITNLRIIDDLPTGLSFVSATTSKGSFSGNTWNIGTLNEGEFALMNLEVRGDEIMGNEELATFITEAINFQDQLDGNDTEDSPFGQLVVYNDTDKDGVPDVTDIDDDNDGIYDTDEQKGTCVNGLDYQFFDYVDPAYLVDRIPTNGGVPGVVSHFHPLVIADRHAATNDRFSIRYSGFIYIEAAGDYTFYTTSDDGSALYINGTRVVDNDGRHNARERSGSINLSAGYHRIDIPYFQEGGQLTLSVSYEGPGIGKQFIPTSILFPSSCDSDDADELPDISTDMVDDDNDGLPNHLDLDSDGDGCSDADEFYSSNSADGGDDGVLGFGPPTVDPNTGAVTTASYVRVLAPEIILGNTSEELGGNDINGTAIALSQEFNYVLRFQNTGTDDATNYTIRNLLPENVIFDGVSVVDAPGTTHTYDKATRTINFQIPDDLVEVGDPTYTIRIKVTVSSSCADFVNSCSHNLINEAYSTYRGVANSTTYSDEEGLRNALPCSYDPEVATNDLSDALNNCTQERKVLLCGADVLLTAGSGFTNYDWYLDTNGNGTGDLSELQNDGNPDNDPRTFVATAGGRYIVQKSGAANCPDLRELINVEDFAGGQTNPIIDFFNLVNSDANEANDIKGEVVTCPIDGDLLPKIFLCGQNDSETLQLGITDAESIQWQQLQEGSCAAVANDDCANKDGACNWTTIGTEDEFTLTTAGQYRVVINYQNGCTSRFYFNASQNNLDFNYAHTDISCSQLGNITITNIANGNGFQLKDAITDQILVPFSANNGPSFDINENGDYKIEITPLDPITGVPIEGACIFSTPDIGILDRTLEVNVVPHPKECGENGSIEVQALNVIGPYAYLLHENDGTGNLGRLIDSEFSPENTHTFEGVGDGNYIVLVSNEDGCLETREIEVKEIPELELNALKVEDISCSSGIVELRPSGGPENTTYTMAIWSKDGTDRYSTPEDIPETDKQTSDTFVFDSRDVPLTDVRNYEFIVFDDSGCYAISNPVTIADLGGLQISGQHDAFCNGEATELTVNVSGGFAPYQYSLDGGATFQSNNIFANLSAGFYEITVIDSSGGANPNCQGSIVYEIPEPFRLNAAVAILEDISCNETGVDVQIVNPSGGQAPYEYSFDGGSSFGSSNTETLPAGDYVLLIRDNNNCTYSMDLSIPTAPANPALSSTVDYACDGLGTITISNDNSTDFEYTYSLNGGTPTTDNTFEGLSNGTYTVTVAYNRSGESNSYVGFLEDFGTGNDTRIEEIGPAYCFEPQSGFKTDCNNGPAGIITSGEYSVTNSVVPANPGWNSPNDHTGLANGRFLAFDVNGDNNQSTVIWAKRNLQVIANEEVTFSFWAYNLDRSTETDPDPEYVIEFLDASENTIASQTGISIPKNTNSDDWHYVEASFDPGTNTNIAIVLRASANESPGRSGAIDDLQVSQTIAPCPPTSQDLTVPVEDGKAFSAESVRLGPPSCNGETDGRVRFRVKGFDPTAGYEYRTKSDRPWRTENDSIIWTGGRGNGLPAGPFTIEVRKKNDTTCTTTLSGTIGSAPFNNLMLLEIPNPPSCLSGTVTLNASGNARGSVVGYQLEDPSEAVIRPFQADPVFTDVPPGTYQLRLRDSRGCVSDPSVPVVVAPRKAIMANTDPVNCYTGGNDAEITVNVTDGNGDYLFRINGGPWVTPSPATATSYTFSGLASGSYTIEVNDRVGCPLPLPAVNINPTFSFDVDDTPLSACNDGMITVNVTGGTAPLLYAFVPASTDDPNGSFITANTFTVTEAMALANPAGYDVYIQDNNGTPTICSAVQEGIIFTPVAPLTVAVNATDSECYNGTGELDITVSGGTAPYTYTLVDQSPADGIDYGQNNPNIPETTLNYTVGAGDYEVTITDANGCVVSSGTETINNAVEIEADFIAFWPAECDDREYRAEDYGFIVNVTQAPPVGRIEYSANRGGENNDDWVENSNILNGVPGAEILPSIRVVLPSGTICQKDFPRRLVQLPLDDLDITLSAVITDCNVLEVSVLGNEGENSSGYQYTYTDDPENFLTFIQDEDVWTAPVPAGMRHPFVNIDPNTPQNPLLPILIPGRSYTFYVRDGRGCIRQSLQEINDIPNINLPIESTTNITPSCDGAANGSITFTLNPETAYPQMRWELYRIGDNTPVQTSGGIVAYSPTITANNLPEGDYYLDIYQVDGSGTDTCRGGTGNAYVGELPPLAATAVFERDISCSLPGRISINNITGGGAPYTYSVTGPAGFTPLTGSPFNPVEIPVNSPAGDYTVTVFDQYGCSFETLPVTLDLSPNPTITDVAVENCAVPFSVTVTATGTGNLRYALVAAGGPAPTNFETNNNKFDNVAPGDYEVYVIDDNGCVEMHGTPITIQPLFQASATLTKALDCTSNPAAQITVEATDGSGNYEYEVLSSAGNPTVARQALAGTTIVDIPTADTYTVNVYDNNAFRAGGACPARSFEIRVAPATEPDFTADPIAVSCNGASDGAIQISEISNGINPLSYTLNPMPATATFNPTILRFEGLEGGTYQVEATGQNGCTRMITDIDVIEQDLITFDPPTLVNFSCVSGNSPNYPTITVDLASISGGSGNYVNFEFDNLADADESQRGPSNTYTLTQVTGSDVDIAVRVIDDTGCASADVTVTIPAFYELREATITVDTPLACDRGEAIRINTISSPTNPTDDPANYEYRQLPATTYQNDSDFAGLEPGTYTFGVRNINTSCEIFVEHIVRAPDSFDIEVDKLSDAVCSDDNGMVQFSITTNPSYTGGFTWMVYNTQGTPSDRSDDGVAVEEGNSPNNGPTPEITLSGGNYLVEIVQNGFPNCSDTRSFTIATPPEPLRIEPIDYTDAGCDGILGTALVTPTGGAGPYTITVTPTAGAATTVTEVYSHLFAELAAADYTVTVTDAVGCAHEVGNDTFTILQAAPISGNLDTTNATLECQGDKDASLSFILDARNVTPSYRYFLNSYSDAAATAPFFTSSSETSPTFNNLGAGFYSITVRDELNCTFESNIFEIVEPTGVEAILLTQEELTCQQNAALLLEASGGTGPYEWSATENGTYAPMNDLGGANTHLFQDISASGTTYQYYVRDSFNCISTVSNAITIDEIEPLTLIVNEEAAIVNCNDESTAIITVEAAGGLGNYEYALFGDAALTQEVRPNQRSRTFSDLPAGDYYVRVQSRDCQTESAAINISNPELLTVSYDVSQISCNDADDGGITINPEGGTGTYQYAISPNLNEFVNDNTFDQLQPGDYTVIIQDMNGCLEFVLFELENPTPLNIDMINVAHEICEGEANGSITVEISGGNMPYTTSIDSNSDADFREGIFNYQELTSGTHVLFIRDASGCEISEVFEVESGVNLTGRAIVEYGCDPEGIALNTVTIGFQDETVRNNVLFGLDTDDPAQMDTVSTFENLTPGNHFITVLHSNGCLGIIEFEVLGFEPLELQLTEGGINQIVATATGGAGDYTYSLNGRRETTSNEFFIRETNTQVVSVTDANGCTITAEIFMEFFDVDIPEFFTPNNDGQNDVWQIGNVEQYPNIFIKVFDRYGRELFRFSSNSDSWDGMYSDLQMPSGDYWYIMKLNGEEDEREFVGNFTLFR